MRKKCIFLDFLTFFEVKNASWVKKAKRMKAKHKKYRGIASDLEKQHYERMRDKEMKLESSGDTHMELMTRLQTITHHATNIARILLDWKTRKKQ